MKEGEERERREKENGEEEGEVLMIDDRSERIMDLDVSIQTILQTGRMMAASRSIRGRGTVVDTLGWRSRSSLSLESLPVIVVDDFINTPCILVVVVNLSIQVSPPYFTYLMPGLNSTHCTIAICP